MLIRTQLCRTLFSRSLLISCSQFNRKLDMFKVCTECQVNTETIHWSHVIRLFFTILFSNYMKFLWKFRVEIILFLMKIYMFHRKEIFPHILCRIRVITYQYIWTQVESKGCKKQQKTTQNKQEKNIGSQNCHCVLLNKPDHTLYTWLSCWGVNILI